TEAHVNIFSKLRLENAITQSSILQKLIPKEGNLSWQPFLNGSNLYMYSAWNDFEKARSLPVDFAVVDEIQSINVEALPVLKEALAKSKFRRLVGSGTGSEEGSYWWKTYNNSDQKEWDGKSKTWIPIRQENLRFASGYHLSQYLPSWISQDDVE